MPASDSGAVRIRGTVKWFNPRRGYGFINDAAGHDIFVHYSAILDEGFRTLHDGDEVEFCQTQGEKGRYAADVQIVSSRVTRNENQPPALPKVNEPTI